jgi:hypothetical protein
MTYSGYITRIRNVRKHPNADRLLLGECFGNQVVVGLDTKDEQLGIYFPTDGQLSEKFLQANNLLAVVDPVTGERSGGFFDQSGRVRTQRFRKERSDGFFCPINFLSFTGVDTGSLSEGTLFSDINGIHICNKYVSPKTRNSQVFRSRERSRKKTSYPLFREHLDTEQLAYNLSNIKCGSYVVITEKVHGTSQRSGHTLVTEMPRWKAYLNWLIGYSLFKPTQEWKYVCGTRRVILTGSDGWYGQDGLTMRQAAHTKFDGKLRKGETVYYELVGYLNDTQLISNECPNDRLQDKLFVKKYGTHTRFTYGCQPGQSAVYVYRITMTNVDGVEYDLSWQDVVHRCQELGVPHVPMLDHGLVTDCDMFLRSVEEMIARESTLDCGHIMEGAVIRIDGSTWKAYKHKSFEFKVIEGIIKDSGAVDVEEQQDVTG